MMAAAFLLLYHEYVFEVPCVDTLLVSVMYLVLFMISDCYA